MNKNCITCGRIYKKPENYSLKKWERSKYCSKECTVTRVAKDCIQCGRSFTVKAYREYSANYCSQGCARTSRKRVELVRNKLKGRTVSPKTLFKKGHRHSSEARTKMSLAKIDFKPWNKQEPVHIVCLQCGKKKKVIPAHKYRAKFCSKLCTDRYKDQGKTELQKRIRTSAEYEKWRKAVFERDCYTCQVCGAIGGRLNADHIKRFADYPELRTEISNGRTLCEECHRKTETYGNRKSSVVSMSQG